MSQNDLVFLLNRMWYSILNLLNPKTGRLITNWTDITRVWGPTTPVDVEKPESIRDCNIVV